MPVAAFIRGKPLSGLCELCDGRAPLGLDHCHEHGKPRGYLCNRCNTRMRGIDGYGKHPAATIHWSNPEPIEPYLAWHERCPACGPVTRRVTFRKAAKLAIRSGLPAATVRDRHHGCSTA